MMPFDDKQLQRPISRLDIAALSLSIMGALQTTRWALHSLANGSDAKADIAKLADQIDDFVKEWEKFTGWSSEDDRG